MISTIRRLEMSIKRFSQPCEHRQILTMEEESREESNDISSPGAYRALESIRNGSASSPLALAWYHSSPSSFLRFNNAGLVLIMYSHSRKRLYTCIQSSKPMTKAQNLSKCPRTLPSCDKRSSSVRRGRQLASVSGRNWSDRLVLFYYSKSSG